MLFQSRSLEDVHDHGLAIAGWRQVYRQMTPGRFKGTVTQVLYDDFHFFRETTNRRVAQTGVSPEGRTSLAVPVLVPLSGTFQRQHARRPESSRPRPRRARPSRGGRPQRIS